MKKQALGKGLEAFLTEDYGILKEDRYAEIDIEKLKPNPLQPRQSFDPESIDDLAQSIREAGVLQPVVAVADNDEYKIIVGERRWRAAQKAGLEKIPVLIRKLDEPKQIEAALIENIQREDLNPLEIARAYQKMVDELHYTQAEIAEKVGMDRASVANYLRLLKLPERIQSYLGDGSISMGHARALIPLENEESQEYIAQEIVKKRLSVREVEKRINGLKKKPHMPIKTPPDPDLLALEEDLIKLLGTKVSISGTQEKGVIKVRYFSMEDLDRIYETIKGE